MAPPLIAAAGNLQSLTNSQARDLRQTMKSFEALDINGAAFKGAAIGDEFGLKSQPIAKRSQWKAGQTLKLDDLATEIKIQIIANVVSLETYLDIRTYSTWDMHHDLRKYKNNRTSIMLLNKCYRDLVSDYEENWVKSQVKHTYAQEVMIIGTQMEGESYQDWLLRLHLPHHAIQKITSIIESGWEILAESGLTVVPETANTLKDTSDVNGDQEIKLKYIRLGLQMVTYVQAVAGQAGLPIKTVYGKLTPQALLVLRVMGILVIQGFWPLLPDTIASDNDPYNFEQDSPAFYGACEHEILTQGVVAVRTALEEAESYEPEQHIVQPDVFPPTDPDLPTLLRVAVSKSVVIPQIMFFEGRQPWVVELPASQLNTLAGRGIEEGYGKTSGFANYYTPVSGMIDKLEEEIGQKNEWMVLLDWMTAIKHR